MVQRPVIGGDGVFVRAEAGEVVLKKIVELGERAGASGGPSVGERVVELRGNEAIDCVARVLEVWRPGVVLRRRQAIVGVGINLGARGDTGLARAPAWLEELLPGIDAPQALLRIAGPLLQAIRNFELRGFAPFQPGFSQRDALMGAPLTLSDGTCGIAQGVNAEGALLLRTLDGLQVITSSEVSLRPVPAPHSGTHA